MYECQSCGRRFSEPTFHRERRDDYGFESVLGCPECGGGYIEIPDYAVTDAAMSWYGLYLSLLNKGWGNGVAEHILGNLMAKFSVCEEPPRAAQLVVECMPERQEMRA